MILASSGDKGRVRCATHRTRRPGTCQDSSIRTALTLGTTLIWALDSLEANRGPHVAPRGSVLCCPGSLLGSFPPMLENLLPLERPLVIFDTETTGTNPRVDKIIEIACVK